MKTVKDWFNWRTSKKKLSIEDRHRGLTKALNWDCTDVLFSFLGIYTIGLLAFYPDDYELCGSTIKPKGLQKQQRAYSLPYLQTLHGGQKYKQLNDALEGLVSRYQSIGNVFPIWPGGNIHKGLYYNCYDLPQFYFQTYEKWAHILSTTYPDADLERVMHSKYNVSIQSFLQQMTPEKYESFLADICDIIDNRESSIIFYANENGIDTSAYPQRNKGV